MFRKLASMNSDFATMPLQGYSPLYKEKDIPKSCIDSARVAGIIETRYRFPGKGATEGKGRVFSQDESDTPP